MLQLEAQQYHSKAQKLSIGLFVWYCPKPCRLSIGMMQFVCINCLISATDFTDLLFHCYYIRLYLKVFSWRTSLGNSKPILWRGALSVVRCTLLMERFLRCTSVPFAPFFSTHHNIDFLVITSATSSREFQSIRISQDTGLILNQQQYLSSFPFLKGWGKISMR